MQLLTLALHNIFSFIVIISVIVFIHEFGHYIFAKKFGVKIESFSIGFGREIFGWNDKSGTRWKISILPMGGYVKMFGDESGASNPDVGKLATMTDEEKKHAFYFQKIWKKFLIVFAGPFTNFLTAIVILSFFFVFYGRPETKPILDSVKEGSAAAQIGLKAGDEITELDGTHIARFEQIKAIVSINPGLPIPITYIRDGKEIKTEITPQIQETTDVFGDKAKLGLIGVTSNAADYNKLPLPKALAASVAETYDISANTLQAIGQMLTGRRSSDEISGIIRIAEYSGKSVEKGLRMVLWFMAILSINLGLVNLFPIPMLDGGHLFFYLIEAVRGKPLSEKTQEYLFRAGFLLLMGLMVFATFNDLKHFNIIKLP